jgi:creatinine amidohydrolase
LTNASPLTPVNVRRAAAAFVVALALGMTAPAFPALAAPEPQVEFELMTWPEVKAALAAGKTTALFYTGGVEQRGPQNVIGGHNLMGRLTVNAIARKLGDAIAMPVLPYTPNNASPVLTGTIGLTPDLLGLVLERISEQAIITGFKNIILMGDHGGGQPGAYQAVAKKLNEKYALQGIHIYYCDDVYQKAEADFGKQLVVEGYPPTYHGGLMDTSEMLYLGGKEWVRTELLPISLGDEMPEDGKMYPASQPWPGGKINNGIIGDARRSSTEIGKRYFDMKVDYAVRQIQGFVASNGAVKE